jgi:hypothetical protein
VLLLYDQLLVWLCCYCMISCLSGCAVIVWSVACLAVLLLYDEWRVWLCCYCMISGLSGCAVIVWWVACLAVLLLYDELLVWLCCYCMMSCLSGCAVIVWWVACLTVLLLYDECVSGCAVIVWSIACLAVLFSCSYIVNDATLYKILMCVVIFSTNFIWTFFISTPEAHSKLLPYIYAVPHAKCLPFCPIWTEIKFSGLILVANSKCVFDQRRTSHLH